MTGDSGSRRTRIVDAGLRWLMAGGLRHLVDILNNLPAVHPVGPARLSIAFVPPLGTPPPWPPSSRHRRLHEHGVVRRKVVAVFAEPSRRGSRDVSDGRIATLDIRE